MDFVRIPGRWTWAIAIGGAGAIAGLLALWHFHARAPYVPTHPLRIGFENNPPIQIRTASGISGLSVEIVSDAAKRAGIELKWVETGTSSEESFRQGLVDLWPMMVDLPHRRKFVHFARPYLHSNNVLLLLDRTPVPGRDFRGPIAVFRLPLLVRQVRGQFPDAQIMEVPEFHDVLKPSAGVKPLRPFSRRGRPRVSFGNGILSAPRRSFASRRFLNRGFMPA
jgi:hypothetical protein